MQNIHLSSKFVLRGVINRFRTFLCKVASVVTNIIVLLIRVLHNEWSWWTRGSYVCVWEREWVGARRWVDCYSMGSADADGQTRIIWLIYWGNEAGTCAVEPPDYLAIIKVRASLLLPTHPLLLPHRPLQLSLLGTFGKQPHGKRQNINGLNNRGVGYEWGDPWDARICTCSIII